MEYMVGLVLALAVFAGSVAVGLTRDKAFFAAAMMAIATYYVLFAAMAKAPRFASSAEVPFTILLPAFVTSELKTVEEGKRYDLVVTPTNLDAPGIGVFRIETDCAIKKHRIQQAFAIVRKPSAAETAAKP